MKNLKSLLSQTLTWTFAKKNIILKSNDQTVLTLHEEKSTRTAFELDGENYIIRNVGFWNPKTIIEKESKQLLVLKRHFLGSRGKIEFENGKVYFCKVRNSPLVKLSFLNESDEEILYYKLEPKRKPKTVLSIVDHSIKESELLMLIILGCYSFKEILKENDDADFITLVAAGA